MMPTERGCLTTTPTTWGRGERIDRPQTPEAAGVTYSVETKLALVRTLIQIEAADGDGRILPALREAEAILEDTMRRGAP